MMRIGVKFIIVGIAIILGIWQLSYTFKYYRMSEKQKEYLLPQELKNIEKRAIKLGLDLKGGMYIVLRAQVEKLSPNERADAVDRAFEIIRNRIDQFGISEPLIAKEPPDRIVIQLPGVISRETARDILQKTAQLEFRLVERPEKQRKVLEQIDKVIYEKELKKAGGDTFAVIPNPVTSLFYRGFFVREEDVPLLKKYLEDEDVKKVIPEDCEFLFSIPDKLDDVMVREVLLTKKEPCLTGDAIKDARPGIGTARDPLTPRVDLTLRPEARRKWAIVTGANVGRRIAIVLDGVIQSAPRVIERIVTGRCMIEMGGATADDATYLAKIIRAGALPVPLEIEEEFIVGPTLGRDSIKAGIKSIYIASVIVICFMLIYYAASGLIANFALFLNILLLLAVLAGLKLTLTLPGIAGIVLTVGMAVDANVLIFERIREELRAGRTIKSALDAGYSNALRTVVDANITTLLMALLLWWKGKGPIKGFGVTLTWGILINLFTAVFVTKTIFDFFVTKLKIKKLSI